MKARIHFSISILTIFFCSVIAMAQRVDYKGGYFEKVGNRWNEYRPQEKSGIHNYFNQVDDQKDWWILDNGLCKVAIPKNPSANNILIKLPGRDWEYKYTATGIRNYKKSTTSKKQSSTKRQVASSGNTKHTNNNNGRTTCKTCHGTGVMTCPACGGNGKQSRCYLCNGTGRGICGMNCATCGGDGILKCVYCKNKGKCQCMVCRGRGWYTSATLQQDTQNAREMSAELERQRNENRQIRNQNNRERAQRHICPVCNGTGVGNMGDNITPDGIAPSNIKYKNRAGDKCPICGSRKYHAHFKCGGCHGSGR